MAQALALKYRPHSFDDLTEQDAVVQILTNQIETTTIRSGYLFVGGAGTGKTTSARIFASMINKGQGEPIELDAASNNSVEDIRRITDEAQTKSLDSDYKVFIIDECHMLSTSAWNAFLKTLEEPPAKAIFILCTTNPEKIPATILSRVQRYNFQRISFEGIVSRLTYILASEGIKTYDTQAVEFIAKIADGGMRDSITLLDKALSYSTELTVSNIVEALGVADYATMTGLTTSVLTKNIDEVIRKIDGVYKSGMDLKQFIKDYFEFVLDISIYEKTKDMKFIKCPISEDQLKAFLSSSVTINSLLEMLVDLMNEIKWAQNAKSIIIARFMLFVNEVRA